MRPVPIFVTFVLIILTYTSCLADCSCNDWVEKEGYCVDYVKTKIPTFPVPKTVAEIAALKNKDIPEVTEGDVAIFDLGNYWHVAYVEKVHLNRQGNAFAIDLSEMNFGGSLSFDEYINRWSPKDESEWKRALCCGVTDKYDQAGLRKNVALNTVTQIWSPVSAASEDVGGKRRNAVVEKVREVLNRFILFTGREL